MVRLIARLGKWMLDIGNGRVLVGPLLFVGMATLAGTWRLNVVFGLNWPKAVWVVAVWAVVALGFPGLMAFWAGSPARGEFVFSFIAGLLTLLTLPALAVMLMLAATE